MSLRLDWCSHEAAKYAVEHWHYSRRMPLGKMVKIGVWEDEIFIGCILYARGANQFSGREYGLSEIEICELVRIALTNHKTQVSKLLAVSIKMLKRISPGIRLIISYADQREGHHGGIYQAANWLYVGKGQDTIEFYHEGRWKHNREVTSGAFGKQRKVKDYSQLPRRISPGKHKYLMPLDDEMRKQVEPLRKPYPKRERGETDNAQQSNAETGGASPTRSLLEDS